MADSKITDLTSLAVADVAAGDVIPVVDLDADVTKKISTSDFGQYLSGTIVPQYSRAVSGAYYAPWQPGGNMASSTGALNTMVALPLLLQAGTLDRIGVYHVGAPTASETMRLGIYASTSSGLPGSLILDAGTVDLSTAAAFKSITISQAVTTGLYWLAACRQGPTATATVSAWGAAGSNQTAAMHGTHLPLVDPTSGIWNRVSVYSVTSTTGAFPSTPTWVGKTGADASHVAWGITVRYA